MDKEVKTSLLAQLEEQSIQAVCSALEVHVDESHPASKRVGQLARRFKELTGRIEQGTLSPADVDRIKRRIIGGLREIILDYRPVAIKPEEEVVKSETFTLDIRQEEKAVPIKDPVAIGFHDQVEYVGSPSKKEESLTLDKSYGAAFHVSVQAIRKCGMEMIKGDREGGRIEATAPGNTVARFGEVIYLWLTPLAGGKTKVHIVVDSANPDTVFDLGRNQQKLQALTHQLRNL